MPIPASTDAETKAGGLVSICITTSQGAHWIRETIESALAQTYAHIEVVVVDDASTDETVQIIRDVSDPRVRLVINETNLGAALNTDRCLRLARGEFIKFLDQDDLLDPSCVERMTQVMLRSPRIGFVFSRQQAFADDPHDPKSRRRIARWGVMDEPFGPLGDVNVGRLLFERAARRRYGGNWVGGMSCVMLRKEAVERVGGFNTRLFQVIDWEMWLRLMFFFEVGFIAEPLTIYRLHARSMTARNRANRVYWMDRAWLVEGLRAHPEIQSAHPELARLGLHLARRAIVHELRRPAKGRRRRSLRDMAFDVAAYLRYRIGERSTGALHGSVRV